MNKRTVEEVVWDRLGKDYRTAQRRAALHAKILVRSPLFDEAQNRAREAERLRAMQAVPVVQKVDLGTFGNTPDDLKRAAAAMGMSFEDLSAQINAAIEANRKATPSVEEAATILSGPVEVSE